MELTERVELKRIAFLKTLNITDIKSLCPHLKNDTTRHKQLDQVKSYCETNVKTGGVTKRIYKFSEDTVQSFGGRLYSSGGVQGLPKKFRGFLMKHTTDIDMKNAHPTILKYLCKQNNVRCPMLSEYVADRDGVLENMEMDREEAKELFLKALNDNKLNTKCKNKIFRKFDAEMKTIQTEFFGMEQYETIRNSVPVEKRHNWMGSHLNRIICAVENEILQHIIHILNSKGIDIEVLMFDGLMVTGDYYADDALLSTLTEGVAQKFPQLQMEFAYKPHNNDIVIPDDWVYNPSDESGDAEGRLYADTDLEASILVYSRIKNQIVFCKGVTYLYQDHMWICDSQIIENILIKRVMDLQIYSRNVTMGKRGADKPYSHSLRHARNIVAAVICTVQCSPDNDWLKRSQTSSLGKLLFANGYYNAHTQKFTPFDDPSYDETIVFWGRIHHNFESFDVNYLNDIQNRFFYQTLGVEAGDFFALQLARGLMGDMVKQVIFGLGGTNTGKTVLTTALASSIGDYFGSFNAENLAYSTSSNDEAQKLRFALLLRHKRIIGSNELRSTVELNGNMIKKISSGGDVLIGRQHCQAEEEFIMQPLAIVLANDLPKIKPYDDAVDTRMRVVSYTKQYVESPSNEFELKRDDCIFAEMKTLRFQQHFVGLLVREYILMQDNGIPAIPVCVLQAKQDWVENCAGIIVDFATNFEISDCESDFITSNDIQDYIKTNGVGVSMKKFGMEMKQYCIINKLKNVQSKVKKIGGKCVQIWSGIKRIVQNEDDEM